VPPTIPFKASKACSRKDKKKLFKNKTINNKINLAKMNIAKAQVQGIKIQKPTWPIHLGNSQVKIPKMEWGHSI
jgi:hypothetical protein